ncbi:hypothetical protein [Azospirillum canadense]|uniref:hypothetical protein n=1 Tax=Azospirillum canadense TaxID=403962 RepID=UPI002226ADD7|nr:hypothetical protein [Azospirillum canadense]MCW2242873.1 hypothetical protein [Azospirillum canadense]
MHHRPQTLRMPYARPSIRPRVGRMGWAMIAALAAMVAVMMLVSMPTMSGPTMSGGATHPVPQTASVSPLRDVIPDFGAMTNPAMEQDGPTATGMDHVPILNGAR